MQVSRYSIEGTGVHLRIAHVSDIHNQPYDKVMEILTAESPDVVAITGDLMSRLGVIDDNDMPSEKERNNEVGFSFIRKAAVFSKVIYSLGNHERGATEENKKKVADCGGVLLDNSFCEYRGVVFGGLTPEPVTRYFGKTPKPELEWLGGFESRHGYKILLSHHPEYYEYLKDKDTDLILAGHAHGGQWRIFGRGLFAPGQGIFPKYTSGKYDGRMIVSRGLSNVTHLPRIFNSLEVGIITLEK